MPVWMWGVYTLAVARLTGLLALDQIAAPLRGWLLAHLDINRGWHRKAAYLVGGANDDQTGCPWCLSVWAAALVIPLAWWWGTHPAVAVPAFVLAASQITGMIAGIGRSR